jgi:hypothetical protein
MIFVLAALLLFSVSMEFWSPFQKPEGRAYVNTTITYHNTKIEQLSEYIQVRYNNLGFIGEDYNDTITRPKIIFVGWSNTQSLYIQEGLKWTDVSLQNISVWHNNAAADGTLIPSWCKIIKGLNEQKPSFVIALIDPFVGLKEKAKKTDSGIKSYLKQIKVVDQIILPYFHSLRDVEIGHKTIHWDKLPDENGVSVFKRMTPQDSIMVISQLDSLRNNILSVGAKAVFVSAPTPYGNYVENGLNMGLKEKSVSTDLQYQEFDLLLKSYCDSNDVFFASGYSMPKSTKAFYDYSHFTLEGSKAFGKHMAPLFQSFILNKSNQ